MLGIRETTALEGKNFLKYFKKDKDRFISLVKDLHKDINRHMKEEPDRDIIVWALAMILTGDARIIKKLADDGVNILSFRETTKWTRAFAEYIVSKTYDE